MNVYSIIGLILVTIGGVLSFIGSNKSSDESNSKLSKEINEKNSRIEEINAANAKLINQNSELLEADKQVSKLNQELIDQNRDMLSRIEEYQAAIKRKDSLIDDLEVRMSKAGRGIENQIDYWGTKKMRNAGHFTIAPNPELSDAISKFNGLIQSKQFSKLINLCNEFIKNEPDWYTSYVYKAMALQNIDARKNKTEVLNILDFISSKTVGDIIYLEMISNILIVFYEWDRIKNLLKHFDLYQLSAIQNERTKKILIDLKK